MTYTIPKKPASHYFGSSLEENVQAVVMTSREIGPTHEYELINKTKQRYPEKVHANIMVYDNRESLVNYMLVHGWLQKTSNNMFIATPVGVCPLAEP